LDINLVCVVGFVTIGVVAVVALFFGRWFHASAKGDELRIEASPRAPAGSVAKKPPRRGKRRGAGGAEGGAVKLVPDLAALRREATAEGGVSVLCALAISASERRSMCRMALA
jgi:hypothetical protein